MRRKSLEAGFTLLEIGLALSIALLASAAVIVFYTQVKESTGDAAMRAKIGSLQGVVESLYTAQGSCPDLQTVKQAWVAKRPDALKSPWGGDIFDLSAAPRAGIAGGNVAAGQVRGAVESSIGIGALYYYRVTNSDGTANAVATASLYDVTLGANVAVTGYGLAGIKHKGWRHFMVTSGR